MILSHACSKSKNCLQDLPGGKIKDVHTNSRKDCGERKLCSIILHVGTNNLVSDDAKEAVKQMEQLIVKAKAENVTVSSIIMRYDNKVPHSKITEYNNLLHELCKKHNITFIANSMVLGHPSTMLDHIYKLVLTT
jgi:diketogulonate reductase-like aldo/keto reductase